MPSSTLWRSLARTLTTIGLTALATGVGVLARGHLVPEDIVMLYMLVIVFAAARYGQGVSLVASCLSVLAYDYFFVPPFHTFAVADKRHLVTFSTMVVVGLLIGAWTSQIRRHERSSAEREKRTAALALERAQLAEVARAAELRARTEEMRSSLLSAVSHDLRTPLGAITGAATTLRDSGTTMASGPRAELIDTICEEAERLERFVQNLLEMTRLQAGALEVKREWVPLEELVGSALTRLERQLEGRPVQTLVPSDLPLISVDPVLIEQVLFNVIDNAAKHTPPEAGIEVAARVEGDHIVIALADHGPGLPPGDEARVFEKFFRGERTQVRGAGLGLAICSGIVAAHGGSISAGARKGGGAVFTVRLPIVGEAPTVPTDNTEERSVATS